MGLTPEAAKEMAGEYLLNAVRKILFPPNVQKHIQHGELCLTINVSTENGDAVIFYRPRRAAESLALVGLELGDATAGLLPEAFVVASQCENIEALTGSLLLTCLHEFTEVIDNIPQLTSAAAQCCLGEVALQRMTLRGLKKPAGFSSHDFIDQVLKEVNEGRRKRLEGAVKNVAARYKPQFQHLCPVYHYLKPIWRAANSCYKRYRGSARWREIVKAACNDSELELPSDLINRLDSNRDDYDSYAAIPSALAVEHAARLCGATANAYKTRTLMEHLKASREEYFRLHGVEEPDPSDCERPTRNLIREKMPRAQHLSTRSGIVRNAAKGRRHLTKVESPGTLRKA